MSDLKYIITDHYGVLSTNQKNWTKEVNMISWNDRSPKLDIREWSPDHLKMGKGITLNHDEIQALASIIATL